MSHGASLTLWVKRRAPTPIEGPGPENWLEADGAVGGLAALTRVVELADDGVHALDADVDGLACPDSRPLDRDCEVGLFHLQEQGGQLVLKAGESHL